MEDRHNFECAFCSKSLWKTSDCRTTKQIANNAFLFIFSFFFFCALFFPFIHPLDLFGWCQLLFTLLKYSNIVCLPLVIYSLFAIFIRLEAKQTDAYTYKKKKNMAKCHSERIVIAWFGCLLAHRRLIFSTFGLN